MSACSHKQDPGLITTQLQTEAQELISKINSAFQTEGKVFSGTFEFQKFGQGEVKIAGTGQFACIEKSLEADLNLLFHRIGKQVGSKRLFELDTKLRKEGNQLFLFPGRFILDGGAGNVQAIFMRLVIEGLVHQWSVLELKKEALPLCFSGIPPFPQLFSGGQVEYQAF